MSLGLITIKPPHALAASEESGTKWAWPISTVAWAVFGALTPINYALPPVVRGAWFAALGAMILIPTLTQNIARPLYPAIWIFVGYASIVSVFLATNSSAISDNAFVGAQLVLLLCLGPFVLTACALSDPKFAERFFISFVAGQTISSFVGFLQSAGYTTLGSAAAVDQEWWGRHPGLAEHPNSFGFMAALAVLLSLQLLTRGRTIVLGVGAVCVNVVGIVVSGSYTAVLALLSGLAVAMLSARDRRRLVVVFLSGVACVLAVWIFVAWTGASSYLPSLMSRYRQVTGQTSSQSSVQGRTQTWDQVLNSDTAGLIFGNGLSESATNVWADGWALSSSTSKVHNVVLRAWFQGGIILGLAFALIVIAVLVAAIRAIARKECGTEAGVSVAVLAYGLVSPLLEQRHFWLPLVVGWGSMSAAAIRSRDRKEPVDLLSDLPSPKPHSGV